jgi:glycosyltransferase involved in cell wall biosynthesis
MESNNKKIAMFSIHSDPLAVLGGQESGGQNIYVRYLAEELEKFGCNVDVFTRWDSGHKKQVANIGKHSRVIRLKGGKVGYMPKSDLFEVLPEIFNSFLTFMKFENNYDIFHGHYWDGGWMALEAHKKFNKPLIENFHSLGKIRMETKNKYQANGKEDEYFLKRFDLEKEIIKESSAIISLSQTEKENLKDSYDCPEKKVYVIPGGVDLNHWPLIEKKKAREKICAKESDFIILFVGRLEWRKGIGTIIAASSLLKKEIPNLKILIIGGKIFGRITNKADEKEYNRLLNIAKEKNVADIVSFCGNVDNRQLPVFYRAVDVFIVPSYYEPFGLVALEGMASRIPVIASRVGGLKTTIKDGENGLLFEPRNALDLKEKILSLYKSKNLIPKLTENAYNDICQNYSWNKVVKKIDDIYNGLM